jgi:GNAT superfamily N-acetyltransferase
LTIERVTEADLTELLPLMRAYCEFYEVAPSEDELLALSRALIADPEREGVQLLAREGQAVGFATIFWSWATTSAERIGVMNDLYVAPEARGTGVAEALIEACRAECAARGAGKFDLADRSGQRSRDEGLRPRRCDAGAVGRLLAPGLVERLGEPPARLLEPEAAVEGVCVAAALGCRQEEQHAAAPAGLALRQGHQLLADSLAPRRLVDDDRAHLRNLAVALERG